MKQRILALLVAAAAISPVAHAADGTVKFTGKILDSACTVDASTKDQTVALGQIDKGAFSAAGDTAAATRFSIKLTACPATVTSAKVKFDGTADAGNNNVLALTSGTGVATGVGVQLANADGSVLPLYTDSTSTTLSTTGVNTLDFVARYIATAATVTPGEADATANFTVNYN